MTHFCLKLSLKYQVNMSEINIFEKSSTSDQCTKFLEFAESLKIPINPEYLEQIRPKLVHTDGSYVDVGVKDSKGYDTSNERRLQNALWRAWWRQRRARYSAGPKDMPSLEDIEILGDIDENCHHILGKDIGDIPTEYSMKDLQDHELPVIGTYIDSNVLPGFRYYVRLCGSQDDYLFEGKALRLARVGAGYGKRLTFDDEDILCSENFFWSDSNPEGGYAFSLECITEGEVFGVHDSENRLVGEAVLTNVNKKQKLISSVVNENGTKVSAAVEFQCKLSFEDSEAKLQACQVSLKGTAICFKPLNSKKPTSIKISDVELPGMGQFMLKKRH